MFGFGNKIKENDVLNALRNVQDPDLHKDIVTLGMVKDIKISGKDVSFTVELTTPACPLKEKIEKDCIEAIKKYITEVENIKVKMSANVKSFSIEKKLMQKVKNVIAIASGKGGVGKSTVSVNISLALASTGAKVGLLDADIYGPTIPSLLGVKENPEVTEDKKMLPIQKYGLKLMSIGFLLKDNEPVIWRGPMVGGVITQFLRDVEWGELDYLIVDLPPGTGDAQLTLSQVIPLSGVVIVSTPEDVALNIATKALSMFQNMRVPILGIVENMSYFRAPDTGNIYYIFGKGGAKNICEKLEVKFLGEIPLDIYIREGGDKGEPILFFKPDSEQSKAFKSIAGNIAASLSTEILSTVTV
jgi:ATP-binding protein involved in chromosome partitioning